MISTNVMGVRAIMKLHCMIMLYSTPKVSDVNE